MKKLLLVYLLLTGIFAGPSFGQSPADEYGAQGYNAYLGGLGLTISYVNIPYQPDFNIDTAGALEAWVYPTTVTGAIRCIISKGASANVSYLFGINGTTGKLYLRMGGTDYNNSDGAAIPLNTWTHVAASWTGGPAWAVTFFVNGAASGATVYSSGIISSNTDAIRIGGSQAFNSYVFIGNIDEVRLWKTPRTAAQVAACRFTGLGDASGCNANNSMTSGAFYNGLVSSWTFNSPTVVYDYVGSHHGTYSGSAASTQTVLGVPVPYNMALKLGGGQYDFLTVPSNTVFNQSSDGTIDLWFRPLSLTNEQVLFSKGSSLSSLSFQLGVAPGGKLYFGTGTNVALNSAGTALNLNQWNHIAVTWAISGSSFEVKFYKNGVQSGPSYMIPNTFPTGTDPAVIGGSGIYNLPANGYIDELRLWNPALTAAQVQQYMFVSARSIPSSTGLQAAWTFDGNLNNYTSTGGINASLNSGGTNNSRISAFLNDADPGAYGTVFISHSTVLNRNISPNPFPVNYNSRCPFKNIPDNNTTGISDTIIIPSPAGYVTAVEMFLSVQHPYIGDLIFRLKAPNGVSRDLIVNNGISGKNILTFISDDFSYPPTDGSYLPPWGYIKPVTAINSFGSYADGNWILTCIDNAANDIGILQGWGLKFTIVTGIKNENGLPDRYSLSQNYPNPFNPTTNIKFDLKKNGFVTLKIYNSAGADVKTLVSENMNAGSYSVTWDASSYPSGAYFLKMESGDFREVRKMVLVK
ncbi:MAG: T9SS type A sorting domain-containing protein [Bacteroidetes bacterium]|nr:T9SS type A sorting domain-containing protein [Bacteroidota bacterium]